MSVLRTLYRKTRFLGFANYCVLCRSHVRRFLPHGVVRRENSLCPVCHSRERHRLAWHWFTHRAGLLDRRQPSLRTLHVAPEIPVAKRLKQLPNTSYISGDFVHAADIRMDVCNMPFADESFDFVYISHVLNMLPRDEPAFKELCRVLAPGGTVLIQVPAPLAGPSKEAGANSSSSDRLALLGDPDIFRHYGREALLRRAEAGGLQPLLVPYFLELPPAEQMRFGLIDEDLCVCRKPNH